MRLLGYQNPTQRCRECPLRNGFRSCCDNHTISDSCSGLECDSFFTYCLRAFGDEDSQEGGCSDSNERVISSINTNDGESIDFTQDTVLGLDNPFHLQGLRNDYAVSF